MGISKFIDQNYKLIDSLHNEGLRYLVKWKDGSESYYDVEKGSDIHVQSSDLLCTWTRAFDGHFNITCPSGMRANRTFKKDRKHKDTRWDFKYCPYCGREISVST